MEALRSVDQKIVVALWRQGDLGHPLHNHLLRFGLGSGMSNAPEPNSAIPLPMGQLQTTANQVFSPEPCDYLTAPGIPSFAFFGEAWDEGLPGPIAWPVKIRFSPQPSRATLTPDVPPPQNPPLATAGRHPRDPGCPPPSTPPKSRLRPLPPRPHVPLPRADRPLRPSSAP